LVEQRLYSYILSFFHRELYLRYRCLNKGLILASFGISIDSVVFLVVNVFSSAISLLIALEQQFASLPWAFVLRERMRNISSHRSLQIQNIKSTARVEQAGLAQYTQHFSTETHQQLPNRSQAYQQNKKT
jgi:hypothetical protein